ncbi:myomegalin-like isoform X9 [Cyprinus carpio]|uniref:Myomegalin-like isoform X9 n=1 Tax=Cyprinus carpio TaxID=7962 RepID=A0A9Q9ZV33_CYPCA|nr:myomegalin-like isoform X9 [Cyprinus carpio]
MMNRSDGAAAAERDFVVDGEGNVCRTAVYMTDCLNEDTDKVPLQTHPLREFEQHLNDLKKENFSLKLRIYFLEERIQQKFEDSSDEIYRTNIELKVEVESLKQELQEKQQLLDKAQRAAESLSNHNEEELQRRCEERQQEIDHMQQVLETKIQILQEEAQLARDEAERMASVAESHSQHPCVTMEMVAKDTPGDTSTQPDEDADSERIEWLSAALCRKEQMIRELTEEKMELRQRLRHMEEQLQQLSVSLLQRERDAQFYQEELGRERLRVQQEMQSLIEEQQLHQYEHAAGQCVNELQQAQLQLESLQNQIHESESSNKELQEKLCEMESELQSIRQAAQNQERTIQNLTDSLRTKDTETQELYRVIEGQKNTLRKITETHQQQLQHTQTPEGAVDSGSVLGSQSSLFSCQLELEASQRTHRLTQRRLEDLMRERERLQIDLQEALQHKDVSHKHNQRSIDEKFLCLEEKDGEERQLQLVLREKDRDLERLRCILSNNNDTITGLDALVRSKDLDLERTQEACRKLEWMKQQSDEKHALAVQERDGIIHQLQKALRSHSRESEELRSVLLREVSAADMLQELQSHLSMKERLFQEVISDRSHQAQEHHRQLTELLHTISSRDQDMKDYSQRSGRVISERSGQLQELRSQLSSREQELNDVNRQRETDMSNSTPVPAQAMCTSSSGDLDVQAIRDELQLTLKKHRETERELSEMRSVLSAGRYDTSSSDQQCVLQQLVSEQQALNEALRAEKSVYEKLRHVQSQDDSSAEKLGAMHAELDSLQVLRQQLEETLMRARETALVLQQAALIQTDYGESSSDEDEDDHDSSSSEEFPDSIEDDEIKLTARSLTSTQRVEEFGRELMSHSASEQRNRDESEMGCSSLARSRTAVNEDESGLAADEEESVRCRGLEKRETEWPNPREPQRVYRTFQEEEEEEEYDEEDGEEGEDVRGPQGKRGPPSVKLREGRWKRRCTRPHSLDLGALLSHKPLAQHTVQDVGMKREVEGDSGSSRTGGGGGIGFWQHVEAGLREQAERLRSDLAVSHQESRELQERLMVSEATVQAQAEQLKDYRELLTESTVQQDSKQVQVDLQDLGYETSGRSENEAERDDTSSPEFDELETGVSLSVSVSRRSGWNADSDGTQMDEPSSLKRLVQDLRSQLSRCHKVIRGLQLHIRSVSNTSDYASSLERTPRKVNWAFQVSSTHSGADEDEGWQSDGPLRPSRELQELVSRVTLLETQIRSSAHEGKSGSEDGKCATWPGKYNTLIQAQARELSHLRQKMREGRGICHILTQHLSDTTKAFEELLRANDIDYYMGQSFREQLSQSSSLAQRVNTKISGRDRSEQQDDKTGHELLALRLSKELQHKDQIIESLHTQLQQRSDTPCSSHAPSETTDQSDCVSFVSDERGSTNEDVDLCSDIDAASEFPQEEPRPKDRVAPTNIFIQSNDAVSQLTNEVRALKEENLALQSRLQASRDRAEETEQLQEAVLSGRVRLQQAELEAEQWKEELRRLQTHNCEQSQQIQQLRQDRQNSQDHNNRLQHEVTLLLQQLAESRQLLHSLQSELQLYDRVCGVRKSIAAELVCGVRCPAVELRELLAEVRALRAQLECSVQENSALRAQLQKQLDHCIDQRPSPIIPASPLREVLYRRQLLHDPSPSPPVRDVGPLYSPYSEMEESAVNTNDSVESHVDLEGEAPDGSFANRNGRHAIGHVDDYSALQQQVMEGRALVQRMEAALQSSLGSALLGISGGKALDYNTVKTLLSDTKTLCQILDEAVSLLKMFWRAALPSSDSPAHLIQKEQSMREEIQTLRLRMAEQEEVLQGTIQRLRCSNRTKESMETFIVNQLSRTRDVLKKARANLEKNELRISSLSSSSSSLCHGKVFTGASAGSSVWGRVTPAFSAIAMETANLQQPAKKRVRE